MTGCRGHLFGMLLLAACGQTTTETSGRSVTTSDPSLRTLPGGYVPGEELWRTLPPARSGESWTVRVPTRRTGAPAYLTFQHGFMPDESKRVLVDVPNTLRLIDARAGKVLEERTFLGRRGKVVAATLDAEAIRRVGPATDLLAPAFFDGEPSVPPHLAETAAHYRADLPRAIQPEFLPLYKEHAADWFEWVGL